MIDINTWQGTQYTCKDCQKTFRNAMLADIHRTETHHRLKADNDTSNRGTNMKAILIDGFSLEVLDTPGTLEDLQRFVGGNIEAGFTVPSPEGRSRQITGYVDEEGLINGKDHNFVGVEVGDFKNVFNGPVIVVGLNDRTGETVGLTDAEIKAVTLHAPRILAAPHLGIMRVPVIQIDTTPVKRARKAKTDKA